jgi:hypothetical protein
VAQEAAMSVADFYALGTGLVVVGIVCGVGVVAATWLGWRKQADWVAVDGHVVEMVSRAIRPGASILYYPVVEFSGPVGERLRFESNLGSRPPAYRVGQTVRVRYDPNDVKRAQIDSLLTRWFAPGGLAALCGLMIVLGFMLRLLAQ